ncbi:MAG: DUF1616 domain-containing protein [Pseudonocardiaceae bacterium]
MRREFARSLLVALVAPAMAIVGVLAGKWWTSLAGNILHIAAGLTLVLILPGSALTTALWPRRPEGSGVGTTLPGRAVGNLERLAWSLGLSIAVAVIGALLLNLLPGGLTRTSWLVLLGASAIVAAVVATARQHAVRQEHNAVHVRAGQGWGWPRNWQAAAFITAIALAGSALWLAHSSAASVSHPGFTQLWLIPQTNRNNDISSATRAQLGVHGYEPGSTRYRLVLRSNNTLIATWSFTLTTDDVWQRMVDLPRGQQLAADLYRNDDRTPYRNVVLHNQTQD